MILLMLSDLDYAPLDGLERLAKSHRCAPPASMTGRRRRHALVARILVAEHRLERADGVDDEDV